jgi:hypothetical protein
MAQQATRYRSCIVALAGMLTIVAAEATCQEVRILLIRPEGGKAVPSDALRTFKEAILDSARDVVFVPTVAEASDLIEFTRYEWAFDMNLGVTQTWRFSFRPLDQPDEPPAGRARPINYFVTVPGRTLDESTRASGERLREAFRRLLTRFRPVVPK